MNALTKIILTFCVGMLISAVAGGAEPVPHCDITIWIAHPIGSNVGAGYASSYLTNIRAKTIADESPQLQEAINRLDGLGMLRVRGLGLLPAAVSWQSDTSIDQLVVEQAETRLSYGELLMAHTLAAKSNRDFNEIVAMRIKYPTWGQLAEQLRVKPDAIILRENTASDRIRTAEMKTRQRASRDPSLQTPNPHLQQHYALR